MKNKLAIFDLDGTLFDTCDVNFMAYKHSMKKNGFELDYEYFCSACSGRHYKYFLPLLNVCDDLIMEAIHKQKKALYNQYLDRAKPNLHLFSIIEAIKNDYHIALVTTASRQNCEDILKYFNKGDLFDLIIVQEDVKRVKPDPEGFNSAMNYFSVEPDQTVIFEDSKVGIEAARRSGANVMIVNQF